MEERTGELAAANRQLLSQIEERERVEATLRQMQRLEAIGQLTSGVAHDFNNLLTVVLGNIGFVEKGLAGIVVDAKLAQRLSYMRTAAERGAKLTSQLLAFSRRQRLEPKPVDLNEALAGMRDLLQSTMGGSVQVNTVLRPGVRRALVDPSQIELVVLNLAINARDAIASGRKPRRRDRQCDDRGPGEAGGAGARRIRHDFGDRHRIRHDRRGAGKSVRAVLHHQGGRQGLRAWG